MMQDSGASELSKNLVLLAHWDCRPGIPVSVCALDAVLALPMLAPTPGKPSSVAATRSLSDKSFVLHGNKKSIHDSHHNTLNNEIFDVTHRSSKTTHINHDH